MQEHSFITELSKTIRFLPEEQQSEVLADYRSHIHEARERGKSDEEIAKALGDPRMIGRTFMADYHMNKVHEPEEGQGLRASLYHMLRWILVLVSILAFNFFFMLWPILGIFATLCGAWIMALLATVGSSIFAVIAFVGTIEAPFALNGNSQLALGFYSLTAACLSLLACFCLASLSRWFLLSIMRYIKINIQVVHSRK